MWVGECACGHYLKRRMEIDDERLVESFDIHWLDDWVQTVGGPSSVAAVVLPDHATSMQRAIASKLPDAECFKLPKSSFDREQGYEMFEKLQRHAIDRRHCRQQTGMCMYYGAVHALCVLAESEFGLASHATAIKVVKDIENSFHMNLLDRNTLDILNIFAHIPSGGSKAIPSLFQMMSKLCVTKVGRRLLRSNLMQPPRDVSLISKRQDCVEEMVEDYEGLSNIQSALIGLSNTTNGADGLLKIMNLDSRKGTSSQKIALITSGLIDLKIFCDSLVLLKDALRPFQSAILESFKRVVNDQGSNAVSQVLESLFDERITDYMSNGSKKMPFITKTQQIFALKSGYRLLDVHRNRFTVATERVHELASSIRASCPGSCGTLSVKYASTRGFFFSFISRRSTSDPACEEDGNISQEDSMPFPASSGLVCLSNNGKVIEATCEELNALNMRIHDSSRECLKITEEILHQQCGSIISDHLEWIVSLQDALAEIDMLAAIARFSSQKDDYIRPTVTRRGPFIVQDGRHPLLEDFVEHYVCNDTYMSDDCSIQILSGPNMAGKSTFLRQNAILTVLAQIGSFVPASYMCLTPFKSIFVIKENPHGGQESSFNAQMTQIRRMTRNLTRESLVLVDEIYDSSSLSGTIALSWAIIEELACSGCKAFIASHVTSLGSNFPLLYPNCTSLRINMCPLNSNNMDESDRKIQPGNTTESDHYGITLAKRLGFPEDVINDAHKIAKRVHANISGGLYVESIPGLKQEKAILKSCSTIDCIKELYENHAIGENQLYESLCRLQTTLFEK